MPERDCSKCSVAEMKTRGCDEDTPFPVSILGERHTRCPRRPVKDKPVEFGYWLRLYKEYRKGNLPEPGSVLEQAAVVLRVFDIMDSVYAQIQEHLNEQQRRQQARGQGGGPQASGGRRPGGVSSRG